jgi:hypothetical protein
VHHLVVLEGRHVPYPRRCQRCGSVVAPQPPKLSTTLQLPETQALKPILKMTEGYTIDSLPKGQQTVLTKQTTGFWGRLDRSPANPDFSEQERPPLIYTFDPWQGCLWGVS